VKGKARGFENREGRKPTDDTLEIGRPEPNEAQQLESARLPSRESYPLSEVVEAWIGSVTEHQVIDFIRLGHLTCSVLLNGDFPVMVPNQGRSPRAPREVALRGEGLFALRPEDAIEAYYRREIQPAPKQRIVMEPYFAPYVEGWSAWKHDLRVSHEERLRFVGETGICDCSSSE
jgi:hypothetical protein